ncbi:chromate transporter [Patescibacteria group bacterium]|nr:chromate transporter [Patescibacteria group bacterium]
MNNKYLTDFEQQLDLYFGKKAPPMPKSIKEAIVKYGPYISLFVLLMSLPAILLAFGLTSLVAPFAYFGGIRSGFRFSFVSLFSLATIVLQLIALPGLFKRSKKAWEYSFYASLVSLLGSLLTLNLSSLVIGGAISFYVLFQIKSYYKN